MTKQVAERAIGAQLSRAEKLIPGQLNRSVAPAWREKSPVVTDRETLDRSLLQDANNPGAWNNLGVSYRVSGQPALAVACYRRALALNPEFPAALGNLGNILKDLGRYPEAIDAHRQALDHHPNDARAWHNLGIVFNEMGRAEDAIRCFDRALERDPSLEPIKFDRAIARLRSGDYPRGLVDFESRWTMPRAKRRLLAGTQWRGEPLAGKRLLIHCEQGFGDNILITRFLPALKTMGATIFFECRPELVRLFQGIDDIDALVKEGDELPRYDYHCASMSLMGLLGLTHASIPAPIKPEIPAESKALAASLLPEGSGKFRIGIIWSGSVTFEGNQLRAAQLGDFFALYEVPGVALYSLQMAEPRVQLTALGSRALITDLTLPLADFADTAALLERLDLVVMTDSAVAHLAGTLGVPVWNLLQEVPYWIYGLSGELTPWYPAMRLLRRTQQGDWGGVFRQAVERLRMLTTSAR